MGTTWEIQVRVAKGIVVLNLIVIMVAAILLENWKPFVLGNICGSTTAIVNFRLLAISMENLIAKGSNNRGEVFKHTGSRALVRLFINGMVIYFSFVSKHVNTVGTVIGLLSIKPVILIQSFLYE
ncbi:MAG: ATP synthase subunit I [Candidatus Alkaliphilus sp. MAG34]